MHLTRKTLIYFSFILLVFFDEECIMARSPKVAEPSLSRGVRRKYLHFDEVHQLHEENQILMITVQTSSGRVSHKKKKKISLPLFSVFFFFCPASNWHMLGKRAHRRILIY